MAYINVITLADAKNYLRIDDTLTDDDAQITQMISAALRYIENWTYIFVYKREKTYIMVNGCVRVYDWPINDIVDVDGETLTDEDMSNEQKTLYKNFAYGADTIEMILDIGIELPANVPEDLKQVAFEIIDLLYYSHETGKTIKKDLSQLSLEILNFNKRFLL